MDVNEETSTSERLDSAVETHSVHSQLIVVSPREGEDESGSDMESTVFSNPMLDENG